MSRLSLCLIVIVPFMIAHASIPPLSPRQDVSAVNAVLSTSTSSFNWWPYPAAGLSTSTSLPVPTLPVPTLIPITSNSIASPLTKSTIPTSASTPQTTASSHSSPASQTRAIVSTSPSTTSHSSEPQSFLRPGQNPLNLLWLVPVCLVSGAMVGCAVGWLVWRRCGEKRDRIPPPEKYAWAYKYETEPEYDDHVHHKDVERGYGHDYSSLGKRSAYPVERNLRMPSTASTSGACTWVGHPQARKRSGAVSAIPTSTDADQEYEDNNDVKSPLLTQTPPSEVLRDSKPLPASPLPSAYPYGDDEGEDVQYEPIRRKSVRRRIWERLGFSEVEGDLGRKATVYEGEGRHTWSAGATQERGVDIGRNLSFWGRRKTMKEGRVERWVRGVMGEAEGNISPEPRQHEAPSESMDCEETAPQPGTPELVLSTLRRVSPSTWQSPDFDDGPIIAFGLNGKSLELYPTVVTQPVATRSGSRGSVLHTVQRPCGVSLQDPGPVSGSSSVSRSVITRTSSASRNAFPSRSTNSSRSKHSQRGISSPTPPSPSSVSRYSATSHIPALTSLNRPPKRTPTRSTAFRDLSSTLTGAMPPSRLDPPVSSTMPPARSSGMPSRARPLPSCEQPFTSGLPAGPSSLVSPPLQSALCFDETLLPLNAPSREPTTARMAGTKLSTSARTHRHSAKVISAPDSISSNARARALPVLSSRQSSAHTPSRVPAPRPLSPKERYLARQNANARVGMILTRSYSSRNFDERPVSPTMFGAVINEEMESGRLEDSDRESYDRVDFWGKGGEGIEQRLDTLRT